MAMNSFAVLADDVEDADDLAPAPPVPAPAPLPPAVKQTPTRPAVASGDARRPAYRGGRGGYRGGRGRGGGYRGGRGRGGGGGYRDLSSFREGRDSGAGYRNGPDRDQRGDREQGGYYRGDRENSSRDYYRGDRGSYRGGADRENWEPRAVDEKVEAAPAAEAAEEAEANGVEGHTEEEKYEGPKQPADMSLDEYLAQKKAKEGVVLRQAKQRKASTEVGGKMAVLKRVEKTQETSIFSTVSLKAAVEERAVRDSTHVAVARNAANQQFFRDAAPRGGRGRGRGGYGGGDRRRYDDRDRNGRYNDRERPARYNERYNKRDAANAPNVDDTNAFPALNA